MGVYILMIKPHLMVTNLVRSACLKIGKAYVYGYDVDKPGPTIDFVNQDVEDVTGSQFIFEMGNKFVVNDVVGVATLQIESSIWWS